MVAQLTLTQFAEVRIFPSQPILRVYLNGRVLACHANDTGSIPVTRSNSKRLRDEMLHKLWWIVAKCYNKLFNAAK